MKHRDGKKDCMNTLAGVCDRLAQTRLAEDRGQLRGKCEAENLGDSSTQIQFLGTLLTLGVHSKNTEVNEILSHKVELSIGS